MPATCLLRFDASPAIGGGHAVRCLALARALADAGWDCRLAYREPTAATLPALAGAEFPAIHLAGPEAEEAAALSAALPGGVDLLVLDHYGRGRDFERQCRSWARHIAVIDDRPNRPHDCDLLIDQTVGRAPADYSSLVPEDCRVLAGTDYAILRPEFIRARPDALQRRGAHRPLERILVSFGMAAPESLSRLALDAIAASGVAAAVDLVLGAEAPHRTEVEAALAALPGGGRVHPFVADMSGLMCEADLAIGGAGSTAWERCCLGLPTLMLILADNQRDIAVELARRGAAESLGAPDKGAMTRLAGRIEALAHQPDELARMAAAAAAVFDGLGSKRLVEALAAP